MGLLDRIFSRAPQGSGAKDEDLFDDEFQRKLDYLALVSRRVFAGRMRAERRTKKSGSGIEFADHRDYQPGDDFRYLDWGVYQKFDRLLVRLFEEEEDLPIYFIVDQSVSMSYGNGDKFRYAKKVAAAFAVPVVVGAVLVESSRWLRLSHSYIVPVEQHIDQSL